MNKPSEDPVTLPKVKLTKKQVEIFRKKFTELLNSPSVMTYLDENAKVVMEADTTEKPITRVGK